VSADPGGGRDPSVRASGATASCGLKVSPTSCRWPACGRGPRARPCPEEEQMASSEDRGCAPYTPPQLVRYGSIVELTRAQFTFQAGAPDGQPCKAGIFCFFWKSL